MRLLQAILPAACFLACCLASYAEDAIPVSELKGEWQTDKGQKIIVEDAGSQPNVLIGNHRYKGELYSGKGFYITWTPTTVKEFDNPEIPEDIRAQLIGLKYSQKGYVTVTNKRSLNIDIFLDGTEYFVDDNGKVQKRTLKYIQTKVKHLVFDVKRDGFQIRQLSVNDSKAVKNEERKKELKEKIKEAEKEVSTAVTKEKEIAKSIDEAELQLYQQNTEHNRLLNTIAAKTPATPPPIPQADPDGKGLDKGVATVPKTLPDQGLAKELEGLWEKIHAQEQAINTQQAKINQLDEQFAEAQIVTFDKMDDFLKLKEEYDKLTQSFIKQVDGFVDAKPVFSAVFDAPSNIAEYEGLNEQIEVQKQLIRTIKPIKAQAIKEYERLSKESFNAGYRLADTQFYSAVARGAISLASDTYDIAKRSAEAGPAGAAIELLRKIGEKSAFNMMEGKGIAPTTNDLGLSSDIENAVKKEMEAAYKGNNDADAQKAYDDLLKKLAAKEIGSGHAPSYKPGEVTPSMDIQGDLLKTGLKRAFKDGITRNVRDFYTSVQFNGLKGEMQLKRLNNLLTLKNLQSGNSGASKLFNKLANWDVGAAADPIVSKVPFLQGGKSVDIPKWGKSGVPGFLPEKAAGFEKQLDKLRNPSKYDSGKLSDSIFKDLTGVLGKMAIDANEIRVLKEFILKDLMAQRAYAFYKVTNDQCFQAETKLQELLNQKNDFLQKTTEDKTFKITQSNEFDNNDIVELRVTLQKKDDEAERQVVLNQTAAKEGGKHLYYIRVNKEVAATNPRNIVLTIDR